MQGTRFRPPVWEDPTCGGAAKLVRHTCEACAPGSPCPAAGETTAVRSPWQQLQRAPVQLKAQHSQQIVKSVACVMPLLDSAVCKSRAANSCQGCESLSSGWLQVDGLGTSQAPWEDFSLWRERCPLLLGIVSSQLSLGHTYEHFEVVKLVYMGLSYFSL